MEFGKRLLVTDLLYGETGIKGHWPYTSLTQAIISLCNRNSTYHSRNKELDRPTVDTHTYTQTDTQTYRHTHTVHIHSQQVNKLCGTGVWKHELTA